MTSIFKRIEYGKGITVWYYNSLMKREVILTCSCVVMH